MRKNTLIVFLLLFAATISNAQVQFWGMSAGGGTSTDGVIFECTNAPSSLTNILSFNGSNGISPYGSLIQANNGMIYGMTMSGGDSGLGTIFQCTASGTLTTIASFTGHNGMNPLGDLLMGSDGNLYGVASYGGEYDSGTIFKCTTSGVITTLVSLNSQSGAYPNGTLIQGSDGNLYGMAMYGGGAADSGTIFKCTTQGVLTTLATFNSTNGGYPYGSLIQGSDGNLYGMSLYGGAYDSGAIFKCTTSGTLTTLVNLNGVNGCFPYGNLIQATDGNLYGMTEMGGTSGVGTLFKCTTAGKLTTVVNFDGTNGQNPLGSLIQASDSNLYGITAGGGSLGAGTIFECTTSGTLTTLDNLTGAIHACDPVRQYGRLLEVNPVLGINNITTTDNVTLYPDPASQVVNLSFNTLPVSNNVVVQIIDISGKELMSTTQAVSNGKVVSVDVSTLSQGMYFVKVINDKNTEVFKFVKN